MGERIARRAARHEVDAEEVQRPRASPRGRTWPAPQKRKRGGAAPAASERDLEEPEPELEPEPEPEPETGPLLTNDAFAEFDKLNTRSTATGTTTTSERATSARAAEGCC